MWVPVSMHATGRCRISSPDEPHAHELNAPGLARKDVRKEEDESEVVMRREVMFNDSEHFVIEMDRNRDRERGGEKLREADKKRRFDTGAREEDRGKQQCVCGRIRLVYDMLRRRKAVEGRD